MEQNSKQPNKSGRSSTIVLKMENACNCVVYPVLGEEVRHTLSRAFDLDEGYLVT